MKWIHLSDIHYNFNNASSRTLAARNKLPMYLSENKITAEHMFITGDFRHAVKQRKCNEKNMVKIVVDYIEQVARNAQVPLENIHIIPGNHDFKRFDQNTEQEKLKKLEKIRQKYIKEADLFSDEDLKVLNEPFSFFKEVCNELKTRNSKIQIPWYKGEIMPCIVGECFQDFSLLCINTCFFCHTDDSKKGNLVIDSALMYRELEDIQKKNAGKPLIILAHHDMGALERKNRLDVEDFLRDLNVPVLYLCGDSHDISVRRINDILEVTVGCLEITDGTKAMISIGECHNKKIQSIKGYKTEGRNWNIYPDFNARVLEELSKFDKLVSQVDSVECEKNVLDNENIINNAKLIESVQKEGKIFEQYYKAWMQPYGLLITDITGVLFDTKADGREEFPDEIVAVLAQLAKRHISICFTTGRGRTGARHLLLNLAQKIVEAESTLTWEALSGEWECITHNGAYLLTTPDKSRSGFLANTEPLCPKKHNYIKFHVSGSGIYEQYKKLVRKQCNAAGVQVSDIKYEMSVEPVSIRFSLERCFERLCNRIFDETRKMCDNFLQKESQYIWYATRGKFEQKEVFEYSLVNKSDAVEDYIKRYRSVNPMNIVRVTNTGRNGNNDYTFLINGTNFSIGEKTGESGDDCFSVVDWESNKKLFGTQATVYLLERLRFYPLLCIKRIIEVDRYKLNFANAIRGARKRSEEIFSFYDTRLAWMDFLYEDNFGASNTTRIFDVKSGAVTFSDYEWSRIEIAIKEKEVDPLSEQVVSFSKIIEARIEASKQNKDKPRLTYFLHTDTHVLFRGHLYYNFFIKSINSEKGTDGIMISEWVKTYRNWFQEASEFIELFQEAINILQNNASIPITYLARKLIIGGLDNIRNILLIIDYFYLRQSIIGQRLDCKDVLVRIGDSTNNDLLEKCNKISEILSKCLSSMYTGVFEAQLDTNFIDGLNKWMDDLERFMQDRKNDYQYFFDNTKSMMNLYPNCKKDADCINPYFTETFPRWRESDCFIENVAAIEIYLSKVSNVLGNKTNLIFWGIPYGSLEHPILANLLCKKHGLKTSSKPCYIMLHGDYEQRHINDFQLSIAIHKEVPQTYTIDDINILMDDTLTTATTIDLAAKCLSIYGVALNDIIVMRYAGLNRISHYLTNLMMPDKEVLNASAPDVSKFFEVISGLVAEAPYSKLHKYRAEDEKPYSDVLGIFDKSKNRIKNYLQANY